jgi:hypothetical protein
LDKTKFAKVLTLGEVSTKKKSGVRRKVNKRSAQETFRITAITPFGKSTGTEGLKGLWMKNTFPL